MEESHFPGNPDHAEHRDGEVPCVICNEILAIAVVKAQQCMCQTVQLIDLINPRDSLIHIDFSLCRLFRENNFRDAISFTTRQKYGTLTNIYVIDDK